MGIQAAVELADKLKPEKIHGRVILVKTVCRKEFEERSGSVCPEDDKNLNRVFPGNPQGTRMDRLAYEVVQKLSLIHIYTEQGSCLQGSVIKYLSGTEQMILG